MCAVYTKALETPNAVTIHTTLIALQLFTMIEQLYVATRVTPLSFTQLFIAFLGLQWHGMHKEKDW